MTQDLIARELEINGIVQGVGFRPFIYQLAKKYMVNGEVANTSYGVSVYLEGNRNNIESFCTDITRNIPPLAHITEISVHPMPIKGLNDFSIVKSMGSLNKSTLISPDVCVCKDCLRELSDPEDRRYQYPFINCTNCGPRYTIIADIPYDRPNTSMKHFKMCRKCQAEYDDPENRRFHAQPNACPECGPHAALYDNKRKKIYTQDPAEKTASLLKQGYILAIKGLGGFHLAADAENNNAVARLRQKKQREEKPFALMSRDTECIREYAYIEPEEESLLTSFQRPIVMLKKKEHNSIAGQVSPGNKYFGAMHPYTPLHYLILGSSSFPLTALVMTSGNMSEEPIAIDNEDAFDQLSGIADYFLVHDRDIYLRSDDSLVRIAAGSARFIRRSRGYIPFPVFLKNKVPQVLACGAELKNTICLTKGNNAFLSQHIGDMENFSTYEFFKLTVRHMKRILDIDPEIIAHDLHPDYLGTQYANEQENIKKIPVQHHHAHIVSCMAENKLDEPVIGLSFDGTGYGTDGNIWGGEVLIAEPCGFIRAGHLSYVPMPGSAAAVKQPWRMAVSYLYDAFGENFRNLDLPVLKKTDEKKINIIVEMMDKKINSPYTSSLGRLFDGIAGIMGLRSEVFYEGQAAVELEMMARENTTKIYDYEWTAEQSSLPTSHFSLLTSHLIRGVVKDIEKGVSLPEISSKFHATLIYLFSDLCEVIRKENSLNKVVLSGGVFQNSILLTGLMTMLQQKGFEVFTHTRVPANDGGISLGQAVVAAALVSGMGNYD